MKGKGRMTTYFVDLTEDREPVERSYRDEPVNSEQIVEFMEVDEEEVAEKKYKDSGFGSQGHLEVDKIKEPREHTQDFDVDIGEEENVVERPRAVHQKLSIQELREHYDIYEACDDRI